MRVLGLTAILLPQLLLFMILNGHFDLLSGWNRTDAALNTLFALFVTAPVAAVIWLVALAVSNRLNRSRGTPRQPLWPAVLLLAEALFLDLLVLSQIHL